MASRVRTLFDEAVGNASKYAEKARSATLQRRPYKAFDRRGVHLFSYEVGRAQVLIDLDDDLKGVVFDPERVQAEACERADLAWAEERAHAVKLLVDAAADRAEREMEL